MMNITKKTVLKSVLFLGLLFGLQNSILHAQWKISEGFEGGVIPSTWTVHDANNDNQKWVGFQHANAHTGNWMAKVECYGENGDDWLITPQVSIASGDVFTFFARAWINTENMEVKLSTTGTAISNFMTMLESVTGIGTTYQEFTYNLSNWAGQNVYLAIRWQQVSYAFLVDDVKVGKPTPGGAGDVGISSIESPGKFYLSGASVTPSGTIRNYSSTVINTSFPVTCKITNSLNTVVYTQTASHTGTLAANATATISFPVWNPEQLGDYTVTMFTALPNDEDTANDTAFKSITIVEHYGTGGPDIQGYRWIDSDEADGPVYNWIEISETGTSTIMYGVGSFSGDDNFSEPISFGFNFPFYGIPRSYFHVDINGELLLGENTWYKPYPDYGWGGDGNPFNYHKPIPGYAAMPNLIAVYWDDLIADEGTGNVYYQTFGSAPNRYCVIQWNNLRYVGGTSSATLCFQVILYENGTIVMQYKNVNANHSGGASPRDFGQSATVAIQNGTAEAGLCYLTEIVQNGTYVASEPPGNLLKNNFAIKFYTGEDIQPPLFTHEEVWNTFDTNIDLTATFSDVSGIASDSLYYNIGNGWQKMTHTSIESPNIYHYELSIPKGSTMEYYFVATDNSSHANRGVYKNEENINFSFNILPTAGMRILLLSPGNKPGFQDYQNKELPVYIEALNQAGVAYDIYNFCAYEEYEIPDNYDIIFAYANNVNLLPENVKFAEEIMKFLDKGTESLPKSFFFASDGMAVAQHPLSNNYPQKKFFQAYIRANYLAQGFGGGTNGIAGPNVNTYTAGSIRALGGSPIGIKDQIIDVYADSPDVIVNDVCPEWYADEVKNPEISSWGAYVFHGGPFNGNAYAKDYGCAVWLDNLIYKSFFITFDLSQFTNDTDINKMIDEALTWFGAEKEIYTITASAVPAEGGTIDPSGELEVVHGNNITFAITANADHEIEDVLLDGASVGAVSSYTMTNVTANHSIQAKFKKKDGISEEDSASAMVYPNPTYGALRIESGALKMKELKVFDMTGRLILEMNNIDNNEVNIDLSSFADGIYFLKVDEKNVKVIKQ